MRKKRLCAWLLSLTLLFSLLPVSAAAEGGDEETAVTEVSTDANSPVQIKKSVNKDGNMLTLEAYLTNEVTQTVSAKPLDIVLVLDQSGSMAYDFDGKTTTNNEARRQYAMKQAVNAFIDKVGNQYSKQGDHRMAIVTFGNSAKQLEGWTAVDASGKAALTTAINQLPTKPDGATNVGAGMQAAETLMGSGYAYAGSNMERQKVVIVFTDGVPTEYGEFDTAVADTAITATKAMKSEGAAVYTVGIFKGADSGQLYGKDKIGFLGHNEGACTGKKGDYWQYRKGLFSGGDIQEADIAAGNRFLNYLSSNYDASEIGIASRGYDGFFVNYRGFDITENTAPGEDKGYYLTTTSVDGLNEIFQNIIQEISTLEIEAGTNAVLSDTLSGYFTMNTESTADITAEKWNCTGKDMDGNYTWEKAKIEDQPSLNVEVTDKTIKVTGFNYTENAVTATTKEGVTTYSGAKLIVTIPIKPDTAYTNWMAGSNLYPTNTEAKLDGCKDKETGASVAATVLTESPEAWVTAYSVSYDWKLPDGVTTTNKTPAGGNYIKGQNYTIDNESYPDVVVDDKTTYHFNGWTVDGTNKVSGLEQTMGTQDVLVEAMWTVETAPATYTIVFDANGGSWSEAPSGYTMNENNTTATKADFLSTDKVGAVPEPARDNKDFKGWGISQDATEAYPAYVFQIQQVGALMRNLDKDADNKVTFYAIWEGSDEQPNQLTYTVRQHFMKNETDYADEDGVINIINLNDAEGTPISVLIADKEQDQTFGSLSQTYLYDKTKTKVNDTSYDKETSKLTESGTTIDLYYYLDENEDDVPDYKQIFISYRSSNLLYGTVTPEKKVAITLDDSDENAVTVTDNAQAGTAMANTGFEFVKWVAGNNGEDEACETEDTLKPTITAPVGGMTYVFTAVFKSVGQDMGTLAVTKVMEGKEFADLSENFALLVKNEQGTTAATLKLHGDSENWVYVSADGRWSLDLTPGTYTIEEVSADIDGYDLTPSETGRIAVTKGGTTSVTVTNSYTERAADLIDNAITIYHKVSGQSDWHGGTAYTDASAHQAGSAPTISYKAELDLSEMQFLVNGRTEGYIAYFGEEPWETLVETIKGVDGSLAMFSGSEIVLHVQLDKQLRTADIESQLDRITVASDWFVLSYDENAVTYDAETQSLTITCVPKETADGYDSKITLSGLNNLSLTSSLSSSETRTLNASGYITGSIVIGAAEVDAAVVDTQEGIEAISNQAPDNGEVSLDEVIPLILGSNTATNIAKLYWKEIRDNDDDDEDTYYFAIEKIDAQDSHTLNGAKFGLYLDGKQIATATSNRSGIAMFRVYESDYRKITTKSDLYYQELTAPEGYVVNSDKIDIEKSDLTTSQTTAEKNAETVRNYRSSTPDLLNDDDHFAYVIGYKDGYVRPYGLISRAETTTIFFRLLKDTVRDGNLLTSNTYTDVPDNYWANTAISTMTGLGIVQGRSSTTFDPQAPITRAQFAAICARFDTGTSSGTQTFSDISGHWAEKYIQRAAELGWIKGFEDGTFRPDTYITRAQAMTMINRVLNRIPEETSDLLSNMNVWPDCTTNDWFYLAVQEATNSHDFKHKAGNYETWTGMNADPNWTRYEN